MQVHHAWQAFFEAMEVYRAHPERFRGRPGLPRYRHKTRGRNLLVFELGCIWKAELRLREIAVSQLGRIVETKQQPQTVQQVRIVPKADHYVVEVVYRAEGTRAEGLNPDLFVALDPGTSVPFRPHLQLAWLRAPPGLWAAGEGRQSTVQQAARASAETAC